MSLFNTSTQTTWAAKGTNTVLGRLCTRDGTGAASPVPAEGNLNLAADYTGGSGSLTLSVYDLTNANTQTYTATLTASSVVTALQNGGIFQPPNVPDSRGCNFVADIPASAFPTAHHVYRAVLQAVTTGGTTGFGVWEGPALPSTPP